MSWSTCWASREAGTLLSPHTQSGLQSFSKNVSSWPKPWEHKDRHSACVLSKALMNIVLITALSISAVLSGSRQCLVGILLWSALSLDPAG